VFICVTTLGVMALLVCDRKGMRPIKIRKPSKDNIVVFFLYRRHKVILRAELSTKINVLMHTFLFLLAIKWFSMS